MSGSRIMKLITGILEAILAIPVFGGLIVVSFGYVPLGIMLLLHVITLIMTTNENGAKAGSILGIVTSLVGWVPVLGWVLHIITAIFLFIGAGTKDRQIQEQEVIG